MSADWIKMRVGLQDEPAVIGIAAALGISEDLAVGKLHKFWSWADSKCVAGVGPIATSGYADGVTGKWIDKHVDCEGFAAALKVPNWLVVTEAGIEIPDFDEHMGKSAKKRANTAKRMARKRNQRHEDDGESVTEVTQRASPIAHQEKEKEKEKEKKLPPPPPTPSATGSTSSPAGSPADRPGEVDADVDVNACGVEGGEDSCAENLGLDPDPDAVWHQLETRLLSNGVYLATKLVDELRSASIEPTEVAAIVDYFEQKKPRWSSGALYNRLATHRPGLDPLLLWPEPDETVHRKAAHTQKLAEQQAASKKEKADGQARRDADQADRNRLDEQFGSQLDSLSGDDLRKLIADHFPEDLIDIYQSKLARTEGNLGGTLRYELLSVLEGLRAES